MNHLIRPSLAIMLVAIMVSCKDSGKVELFNGNDLSNWTSFAEGDADPGKLFYVEDGLIHTPGIPNGYLRTNKSYRNYKFHAEYRWVEEPKNSGILFHFQGEDKIWPSVIECQLAHNNAGDLILIDSDALVNGEKCTPMEQYPNIYRCEKFKSSSEKPAGQWNTVDITCEGDSFEFVINGVMQMKGTDASSSGGNICLQSEGGPMEFRNVYLEKLD